MKRQFGILCLIIILASLVTVQATVTLAPKTPASTEKVVVIMFDDGWLSPYTTALPILQSYGYKASFAIYPKAQDGQYSAFMSWAQVEDLSSKGYDVESHTYSHLDLNNLTTAELQSELVDGKAVLAQHGIEAAALVYPYGSAVDNATVRQAIADAGYLVARSTTDGKIDLSSPTLDYYGLNCYHIMNTTDIPYFRSSQRRLRIKRRHTALPQNRHRRRRHRNCNRGQFQSTNGLPA
jgi:peptidoglycan/xylan/chitin deacetylase (PgdA/CDA1 family)